MKEKNNVLILMMKNISFRDSNNFKNLHFTFVVFFIFMRFSE